ncbi:uncharacterized protein LOC144908921 [Branchiostoma floridae x Branchiostoma belcheri]
MDFEKVFADLDKSGDGTIDSSELKTFLQLSGLNPNVSDQFVERIKTKCDVNSDGKLTKVEAEKISQVCQEIKGLVELFEEYDKDGSMTMSYKEMRKKAGSFLREQGDKYGGGKVRELLDHWDGDKDKEMTLGEFLEIIFGERF